MLAHVVGVIELEGAGTFGAGGDDALGFGLSNLLLTPQCGPNIRLISVITNAPLRPSPLSAEHICKDCRACIKACPSGALALNLEVHSWSTGRAIDYERCNRYMKDVLNGLVCGLCIKACPIGRDSGSGSES